ncbi:hypothetical protein ACWEWU_14895, partial [Staphylococcus xylosus]
MSADTKFTVYGSQIQKWIDEIQMLAKERDQYKAERDTCLEDIEKLCERNKELEQENQKQLKLLQDFSEFIDHKLYVSPANDAYKHYRYELDKLG